MGNYYYPRLRSEILTKNGSYTNFARKIGKSNRVVSAKLAGRVAFTVHDIKRWCNVLEVPIAECGEYFFDENVAI